MRQKNGKNVPVETVADGAAHIRQTKQEDVELAKPARYHRHQYAGSFGRLPTWSLVPAQEKFWRNVEAIRTLKMIESEGQDGNR